MKDFKGTKGTLANKVYKELSKVFEFSASVEMVKIIDVIFLKSTDNYFCYCQLEPLFDTIKKYNKYNNAKVLLTMSDNEFVVTSYID